VVLDENSFLKISFTNHVISVQYPITSLLVRLDALSKIMSEFLEFW